MRISVFLKTISRLPLLQEIWFVLRKRRILKTHRDVADFWHPVIKAYFNNEIEKYSLKPKKQLPDNKIIWQYWGQGLNMQELPEIVRICFDSVDQYKDNYLVIRLSDETISDYIDLPAFVWQKRKCPEFNRTFFSDLLRLALLNVYGGVWLDATILLTGKLPESFGKLDYFMYQRSEDELHKRYWENSYAYYWGWHPGFKVRALSSIFFAKKNSPVVATLLDLMLYYWKTQDSILNYFFFHILYNELITGKLAKYQCPVVNDCIPHLIQTKINNGNDFVATKNLEQTTIHKMTYFDEEAMGRLKEMLNANQSYMKQSENDIPLVIAFTPNYFIPAATCLLSIFEHTDTEEHFHIICLLSEELPERLKQKIQEIGGKRARFSFINLQGKLPDIYVDEKYTVVASYRLLLPDLLPEYDKVMYIDCDVVVRNDLSTLYRSVELGNNYLAAVFEAPMDFQEEHLRQIGCDPSSYINSGFLIMNLALMRQDHLIHQFMEASKADYLEFPDQDVLNSVCKNRILSLPPYYNSIRTFYLPQYKRFFLRRYTEQEWKAVHLHGTVHYTGAKPWNHFTVEFKVWWQYYDRLPEDIKKEGRINKKMYYLYKLYKTVPGTWLINGIQLLYRKLKHRSEK
jgi:lipopolysaccharide biosynthesis glycosyltransferase